MAAKRLKVACWLCVTWGTILRDFWVDILRGRARVPGARIAECPNPGQKSQERRRADSEIARG